MVRPLVEAPGVFAPGAWELLPMRFHRLDDTTLILTNLVGEHDFVSEDELLSVIDGTCSDQLLLRRLRAKHLIREFGEQLPMELLALKLRTRLRRLGDSTSLHMFVLTLRCEHTCRYCQVSRQSTARHEFDMSWKTARKAIAMMFCSPSPRLKVEFQGGEPLLNFPLLRRIVLEVRRINETEQRDVAFVVATNLALLDDEILEFCAEQRIDISTSLDGPADLHNANRRRPGRNSWELAVDGLRRVQSALGSEHLSALMTTTDASLGRVREIVDTYVDLGLQQIFLRPISPYGFATRDRAGAGYDQRRWLSFYEEGLDYILELNRSGVRLVEAYTALVATKIWTNDDPGYIDLTSPAGIGIGGIVYNYDGAIYASDEGRMLAEMGDRTFQLGNLADSTYRDVMLSDALLQPLSESLTLSAPQCSTCAFEPYCGADPVYHHATQGDYLGHKSTSGFCQRNMGVFAAILNRAKHDAFARQTFQDWARR